MHQKLHPLLATHNIDGYIIPHSDEYQNEHTPDCAKRLEYITGFTGSNGIAIITKDNQYFWTDGRYKIQAEKEVPDYIISDRDFASIAIKKHTVTPAPGLSPGVTDPGPSSKDNNSWIPDQVRDDGVTTKIKIGYNPMLFTASQLKTFAPSLELIPIKEDLVDAIWQNKPKLPETKAYIYPLKYAGMDTETKLAQVRKNFATQAKYAIITEPDSLCWLLNIRGADIESVPVILGYMLLSQNEVICFTDISKIPKEIHSPFVEFRATNEIFDTLKSIKEPILIDPTFCSIGLQNLITHKIEGSNPCLLPKACKNATEIDYMKQGHIKDAVALCTGLAWIQNNPGISEHDVSLKLTELRSKQDGYVMDSFPTIAGFRENGASIHYRAPVRYSKIIEGDGMLLVDSGAHYWGCTTDVTRVLVFGKPTDEQKRRYTQVLKGHIALASVTVPTGTFGGSLDICARQYLYSDGVDYVHGTGHGVGAMLNVHEYPRYIWSPRANVVLQEGMVVSDEPGFYKEGEFGVRIENMLYVKRAEHEGFLSFEMLTLVPYARDLINMEMLTSRELEYLYEYYERIRKLVLPSLEAEARIWCEYQMDSIHPSFSHS